MWGKLSSLSDLASAVDDAIASTVNAVLEDSEEEEEEEEEENIDGKTRDVMGAKSDAAPSETSKSAGNHGVAKDDGGGENASFGKLLEYGANMGAALSASLQSVGDHELSNDGKEGEAESLSMKASFDSLLNVVAPTAVDSPARSEPNAASLKRMEGQLPPGDTNETPTPVIVKEALEHNQRQHNDDAHMKNVGGMGSADERNAERSAEDGKDEANNGVERTIALVKENSNPKVGGASDTVESQMKSRSDVNASKAQREEDLANDTRAMKGMTEDVDNSETRGETHDAEENKEEEEEAIETGYEEKPATEGKRDTEMRSEEGESERVSRNEQFIAMERERSDLKNALSTQRAQLQGLEERLRESEDERNLALERQRHLEMIIRKLSNEAEDEKAMFAQKSSRLEQRVEELKDELAISNERYREADAEREDSGRGRTAMAIELKKVREQLAAATKQKEEDNSHTSGQIAELREKMRGLEGVEQRMHALEADLATCQADFRMKEKDAERLEEELGNLRKVLERFTDDRLAERSRHREDLKAEKNACTEKLRKHEARFTELIANADKRAKDAEEKVVQAGQEVARVEEQLKHKIAESASIKRRLARAENNLKSAEHEELVDRRVVNKLLVTYLDQKSGDLGGNGDEVVDLMSRILGFSAEQKARIFAGRPRPAGSETGVLDSLMGGAGSGIVVDEAAVVETSFGDLWDKFMLQENSQ